MGLGWEGGGEHYLTYLNLKSKQSITSFIDWHGAEFALQLGYEKMKKAEKIEVEKYKSHQAAHKPRNS